MIIIMKDGYDIIDNRPEAEIAQSERDYFEERYNRDLKCKLEANPHPFAKTLNMMKGVVIMRYISHYEEYPIYEPAEGGYYYPGNQLVASERKSKRQCRKDFEKIWQECLEENKDDPEYPWIRANANYIYKNSKYIGEGESYTIERNQGSMEHGYEPYC